MEQPKIIIAIDGFSSCGKSTIAKQLSVALGYKYIDSGAMYRAITLYFLRHSVGFYHHGSVVDALQHVNLSFEYNPDRQASDILLNEENVSLEIREMPVSNKVSEVAAIKEVRLFAVEQQQKMGIMKGIVMDGRDIGTVVFPQAELKVFMTADPAVRVLRRFHELYEKNNQITIDEVRHNLELRDYIDSTREESPLKRAKDAILLDNSNLTPEEQLNKVLGWVQQRTGNLQAAEIG
ncbi:MAG: (d)CMP kinase [Chitinophagia bacterium]|nr:(d)CMP kinase [Chitinophagia bacterium]